jgi:capsular polysaccharide biosynthesis protein
MDILGIVSFVRRRWAPLLLCVIAGFVGAAVLTLSAPKTYQSSSRLFVNIPAARGVQEALQGVQLSSQLIESYAKIAESRSNAELVAKQVAGTVSIGKARSTIHASPIANTLLLDLTATDTNKTRARDLANASATVLIKTIDDLEAGKQDAVKARIIDSAVTPSRPISPRPKVDLTIGLLLGLAAGVVAALVLEAMDRARVAPAPLPAGGELVPLGDRTPTTTAPIAMTPTALGNADEPPVTIATVPPATGTPTRATRPAPRAAATPAPRVAKASPAFKSTRAAKAAPQRTPRTPGS